MRKTSQMNSRNPKKFKPIPAKFIIGTLMILFAITGCSDMPYTGSNLTDLEVDRYLVSTDGESVCFQDDLDATCIRLIPETQNGADANNRPNVYIYPERRVYMLYHEGRPVVRAQRVGNNGGGGNNNGNNGNNGNNNNNGNNGNNGGGGNNNGNNGNNGGGGNNNGNNGNNGGGGNNNGNNGDNGGGGNNNGNNGNNGGGGNNNGNNGNNGGGGNNNGNNGNNNGDNGNNPDDTDGDNNGDNGNNPDDTNGDNNGDNGNNPDDTDGDNNGDNGNNPDDTNDGHGWIIWVYYPEGASPKNAPTLSESGVTVTINGKQLTDEDITGFAQFIGSDGERGIQFFYPTKSAELLDLKIRIEGVVSDDETVKFNINYLWNAQ